MVKIDLTKEEIVILIGALGVSSKDEFGNDIENNIIPKANELRKKLSKAWTLE